MWSIMKFLKSRESGLNNLGTALIVQFGQIHTKLNISYCSLKPSKLIVTFTFRTQATIFRFQGPFVAVSRPRAFTGLVLLFVPATLQENITASSAREIHIWNKWVYSEIQNLSSLIRTRNPTKTGEGSLLAHKYTVKGATWCNILSCHRPQKDTIDPTKGEEIGFFTPVTVK